ncbi:MAG: hypothetical protein MI923_15300 [Phycisphaerales bacterium]|nr:hypothetical protein [Phycisphaerales bacterium]
MRERPPAIGPGLLPGDFNAGANHTPGIEALHGKPPALTEPPRFAVSVPAEPSQTP